MCGIFGFKLNRALNESDLNKSLKYLNLLINRGPDNQGYYIDKENGVFLGHTRLSIIDLSKESNQPFIKDNSVIVYNGEVYNYKELKEELNYSNFLLQRYDYLEKSMERLFHRYVVAAFEQPAPVVAEASAVSKRAYSHFSRVSKAQPVAARCF